MGRRNSLCGRREPTFAAFLTRGQTDAQGGVIAADTFDEIWADTGNWLTFGSYSSGKDATGNWANDVMTIKGIALYGADEKDFATDIQAPVITLDKAVESVYMIGEKANFPELRPLMPTPTLTEMSSWF